MRALLALSLALLSGCSDLLGPSQEARAEEAWDRWVSTAPAAYRYELLQSCFCGGPGVGRWLTVIVNDNVVVAAWETDTGEPLAPGELTLVPTVDDLFVTVFDAIDRGADGLDTEYERQFGYPVLVDIDYIRNAIDDELVIRTRGLLPL
jgi:hypothetical protein